MLILSFDNNNITIFVLFLITASYNGDLLNFNIAKLN